MSNAEVEAASIGHDGIWSRIDQTEYFLAYEDYPWFRDAKVSEIRHVELFHNRHLHWPDLDVDLSLDSLKHPEAYPLTYR